MAQDCLCSLAGNRFAKRAMVVPLGQVAAHDVEIPPVVKEIHSWWWWTVLAIFISCAVGDAISGDIYNTFIVGLISCWIIYITKDSCAAMTQPCLLALGAMTSLQAFLELTSISGPILHGRTANLPGQAEMETHAFFDGKVGWRYNLQSAMILAQPVVMIIGALMSKASYMEFPTTLAQALQLGGENRGMGDMEQGGYGAPAEKKSWNRPAPQGKTFEGSGQRLGHR